MTAFDYARSKLTADRLITKFGQTGTLTVPGTPTGPAYAPTLTAPTPYVVKLAVMEYANNEVDGVRVLATDKKVYLAKGSLTIEPDLSHTLTIGGVEHSIVNIKPLAPGGTVVYFEVQVRR